MSEGAGHIIGGSYAGELAAAERLALAAGELVMKFRDGDLGIEMKPGDEPVTVADRAASDLIVRELEASFPDDIVISEERVDNLDRLEVDRVWYIDPIDGTKDFIRGETGFAIMIGMAERARPVVGALYQPTSGQLFLAAAGTGSYLIESGGEPERLRCSEIDDPAEIRLVASKSHRSRTLDKVKATLGIADELNIGSVGLKLGVIAIGARELYVNAAGRTKLWDTCGPQIVLEEAGGTLTDVHGDPLRYDVRETRNLRGLLATNGRVHQAVVDKLKPIFPRDR